mmetsp:Transcript_7909/g.18950  ORF Transcript_7909/g.18950 Transcript_7909/m.18950 type:complete len:497 (+) Transcript_7909:141-1631(+)
MNPLSPALFMKWICAPGQSDRASPDWPKAPSPSNASTKPSSSHEQRVSLQGIQKFGGWAKPESSTRSTHLSHEPRPAVSGLAGRPSLEPVRPRSPALPRDGGIKPPTQPTAPNARALPGPAERPFPARSPPPQQPVRGKRRFRAPAYRAEPNDDGDADPGGAGSDRVGSVQAAGEGQANIAAEEFRDDPAGGEGLEGEDGGGLDAVLAESKGGYPHADPVQWLKIRMSSLHLLKQEGISVAPVVLASENVRSGKAKYKVWTGTQAKTLSLEEPFIQRLPARDYGGAPRPAHKTCALVGNSGILLGTSMGKQIDAHDAVMRINYPPVRGFERDVGTKTTYDFSNRENARRLLNSRHFPFRRGPSTLLFFEVSSPINRRSLFGPLMEKHAEGEIHYLHPDFVFRSLRLWNELQLEIEAQQRRKFKRKPMSGWLAVMFMTQVCEKVDIYGFEAYNNPRAPHPYHYFDKVKAVLKHHSFDFAIEAYKLLGKLHPVSLTGI